jgi:hypothetical protein
MFSPIRIILIFATVISTRILAGESQPFALIFLLPVRSRNRTDLDCSVILHPRVSTHRRYHAMIPTLAVCHSRDGNRQAQEPELFWHPNSSRNSEMTRVVFQENSPRDCKKPIRLRGDALGPEPSGGSDPGVLARTHRYRTHRYRTHRYRTHRYRTHRYRTHPCRTHHCQTRSRGRLPRGWRLSDASCASPSQAMHPDVGRTEVLRIHGYS